jgi:hypothetical protein
MEVDSCGDCNEVRKEGNAERQEITRPLLASIATAADTIFFETTKPSRNPTA